jgi:hypothetical protein
MAFVAGDPVRHQRSYHRDMSVPGGQGARATGRSFTAERSVATGSLSKALGPSLER